MGAYIETQPLGLTVLGQVQRCYTVDGQPGLGLDAACMASTFKRVVSIEAELTAMGAAVKRRQTAIQALGRAMAEISAATAYIGKTGDDKYLPQNDSQKPAIQNLKNALSVMKDAKLDTSMFDANAKVKGDEAFTKDSTRVQVSKLRRIREEVKFLADQERNQLQRNTSVLQSVLNKRDSAVSFIAKLRKRLDKTQTTAIRNMGR